MADKENGQSFIISFKCLLFEIQMDGHFVHQLTKLYWNSPKNWVGSNYQLLFVLFSKTTYLFQIILVEPDSTRLGWGVATFVGFLQDLEVVTDKDDSRCKSY